MLISDSLIEKNNLKAIETTTSNSAMGFLAPIFFAGIGLEFNMSSISNIGLLGAILAVSYLSKIAGGFIGGTLAGLSKRVSLTLGVGLNARGNHGACYCKYCISKWTNKHRNFFDFGTNGCDILYN